MSKAGPDRVLQVVFKMDRAGVETLLMRIYRSINRDKLQFDFLVHTDQQGHYDNEIRELGGRILCLPLSKINYYSYLSSLKIKILRNNKYIGVHSHLALFSGLPIMVACNMGIPIRIVHGHSTSDGKRNSLARIMYRRLMRYQIARCATHMIAVSRPAGEWLFGESCWKDRRVSIFRNAIDLEPYRQLESDRRKIRKKLGLPVEGLLVGHVGRFVKSKNHKGVLEIFSHFLSVRKDVNLILVGEGENKKEIDHLIERLGLHEKVHILGTRSDIPELMGALDLFLFPSHYEGLGIVLIEAQAAGVPCLVSDAIPFEADLGLGLVKFLPLSSNYDIWVETMLGMISPFRIPWLIREAGLINNHYDIAELTHKLQELYLNAVQKNGD